MKIPISDYSISVRVIAPFVGDGVISESEVLSSSRFFYKIGESINVSIVNELYLTALRTSFFRVFIEERVR